MKFLMKKIYSLYKKEYFLYTASIVFINISVVLIPFYNGKFIDELIKIDDINLIKYYAFLVVIFSILNLSFEIIAGYIKLFLTEKTKYSLKMDIVRHLRKINYLKYKTFDPEYLNQRMEQDIGKMIEFILTNFPTAFVYVIKLSIVGYILVKINRYIAFSILILMPLYVLIYLKFKNPLRESGLQIRESQNNYYKEFGEQLKYMYNIKLNANYIVEDNFMSNVFRKYMLVFKQYANIIFKFNISEGIISLLFQIATLMFGGYFVINKKMTVGELAVIGSYYGIVESIVKYYSSLGKEYQLSKVARERVEDLLNIEVEEDGNERMTSINNITGNITFKYSDEKHLFKDYKIELKTGDIFIISGINGSGKSTLLKLMNGIIPEFYDGDISGSVMVNGMNTFTTPIYKLSNNVGSVFQNPKTQFYTTNTTDEIAFGLENYGIEREVINKRIEEVEKELHLDNLMNKNIFNLSGGEKQKIAIASIYALNPEIFILDEPSSSLDIKSIKELSLTIKKLKSLGKTIIIAEHRLWYLKDIVDRAIYLEDGKIIREYSMDEIENLSEDERMRTGLRHSDYKAIEKFDDFETSNKGTLLDLKNLIFKRNTRMILSIEDLKFCYGNIIGIVGENGIGKSTLAKIICGLYKENKGKILKDDENLNIKSRLSESLLIMQEVNCQLFTDTVKDEIVLTSNIKDDNALDTWLKDMELKNISDRNPHTLSGGQKQRVIILSALLSDKKILFFDEPTSGLDYRNMKIVAKNIKKVKEEDKLILIISHDVEFLDSVCDKVIDFTYL